MYPQHTLLQTLARTKTRFFKITFQNCLIGTVVATALAAPLAAHADTNNPHPAQACLQAWDKHPFGSNPKYKQLAVAVKVFGIGQNTIDNERTQTPSLVMVSAGVNVMGGNVIELLNPNGWYCLSTNVNVMGGLTIRAHCKAKLATTNNSGNTTVLGNNQDQKGVTVMGSTSVERVGCE